MVIFEWFGFLSLWGFFFFFESSKLDIINIREITPLKNMEAQSCHFSSFLKHMCEVSK